MIEQQYYTRDRRGLFSKTPGYDTVAKSKNLNDEFIINTLQDLCFYESPADLIGEEDISKYPKSLFCVNTEDGKMVIGQSVFAGKDYTGERTRYFTHNYIISKEEKEHYIKNPERIIYLHDFKHNYDINKGFIIPEVLELTENKKNNGIASIDEMFSISSMDEKIFINLIKASFKAAQYGKKIYIVLDCDSSNITDLSKEVLKYLYRTLPFAIRRKLGFITYMKTPRSKKLINIIFLCKGSLKRLTTEIKSGYVFDLPNKEFYIQGIDKEKHYFIDFVIKNIENLQVLDNFFHKIDKSDFKCELNLRRYDDIFNLNKKECENTEKNVEANSNNKDHKENKKEKNSLIISIANKIKKIIKGDK